jgi:hypothetical protein
MRSLNGRELRVLGDEGLKESMVVLGDWEKSFRALNGSKDELERVHLKTKSFESFHWAFAAFFSASI